MASERFSREGLKNVLAAKAAELDCPITAGCIRRDDTESGVDDRVWGMAKAALDYIDRFDIGPIWDHGYLCAVVKPRPVRDPRLDAAAKRVAEAQDSLTKAQAELEAAQREER